MVVYLRYKRLARVLQFLGCGTAVGYLGSIERLVVLLKCNGEKIEIL